MKCGAYDHRGTRRCTRDATHVVTELRSGTQLARCSGHARKYRTFETVWSVTKEES